MLSIKVKNSFLDIREDLTISIKWLNPIFTVINEGYSYSFSVPDTPNNKRLVASGVEILVLFKGILVERGEIVSFKNTDQGFEINMITEGLGFRKKLESMNLATDFEFDKIQICDESDDAETKIEKWYAHMTETISDNQSGSHKFPSLTVFPGNEDGYDSENVVFEALQNSINPFMMGEYQASFGIPVSFNPGKVFPITVAPTPRIEYLLKTIVRFLGCSIFENELDSIDEFKEMFTFNNFVLDKIETESSISYNVHGTEIDLNNHVPITDSWKLFQLLIDFFDCYFVKENTRINVYLASSSLNREYIDYTKYSLDGFENETQEQTVIRIGYDLEEGSWNKNPYKLIIDQPDSSEEIKPFSPVDSPVQNNGIGVVEQKTSFLPLISRYLQSEGFSNNYPDFLDYWNGTYVETDRFSYGEYQTRLSSVYKLVSAEFPDNGSEIATVFQIGFFRGMFDTLKWNTADPSDPSLVNHAWFYNFREIIVPFSDLWPFELDYLFGQSSAYISGPENTFDKYLKRKIDFLQNSEIKKKQLFLPLHKLLELKRWKQTNHFIQQRNESFRGTVAEISFTISNRGISPALISYYVEKSTKGQYNSDYNNDYTH